MGIDYWSAVLVGTIAGRLFDPLAWVLILAMLASGYLRVPSWWVIPAGALVATAINVGALWSWWRQIGVSGPGRVVWTLVSLLIIAAFAYGIGRLTAGLFSGERPAVPKLSRHPRGRP
jgi:hypothetical protein